MIFVQTGTPKPPKTGALRAPVFRFALGFSENYHESSPDRQPRPEILADMPSSNMEDAVTNDHAPPLHVDCAPSPARAHCAATSAAPLSAALWSSAG